MVTHIADCIHVQTKRSNVWIDDISLNYLRLPIIPTRDETQTGALEDNVWHPLITWRIGHHPLVVEPHDPGLLIEYRQASTVKTAWFPEAAIIKAGDLDTNTTPPDPPALPAPRILE